MGRTFNRVAAFLALALLATGSAARADALSVQPIGFNASIRPLLSDRCFSCHGPDLAARKAHLRLDLSTTAFAPLIDDPKLRAIVPGHPELSEVYRRITSADPKVVMPPADSHLKLTAVEKDLIRRWIAQGAPWQQYWAFVAPVRPALPAVKDAAWPRNPIDRFVLAKLEKLGLHPSPRADKGTLIRRVSLDLTGIPPTTAEVDAFLADDSPDAYEKVVDRLLASPRYGEQMAITWLDEARYADSHGFQSDPERFMWRWRDWVINAYNKDMPFDEFTVEQLAGDLLPHPTTDQLIATGFNRNHRINGESGSIAEEWRIEGVIDRVDTTSEVFLGLTMGCCRCHDHKFDPISQKEFYRFSAFFNSVNETGVGKVGPFVKGGNVLPVLKLPSDPQKKELADFGAKVASAQASLKELDRQAPRRSQAWAARELAASGPAGLVARFPLEGDIAGQGPDGKTLAATFEGGAGPAWAAGQVKAALSLSGKGVMIDAGDAVNFTGRDAFSFGCWIKPRRAGGCLLSKMDKAGGYRGLDLRVKASRLELRLVHQWPASVIKVTTVNLLPKQQWAHVMVTYDGSQKAAGVKIYVDAQLQKLKTDKDHLTGVLTTAKPLIIGGRDAADSFSGSIQEVEFYSRALPPAEVADAAVRPLLVAVASAAPDQRTKGQTDRVEKLFRQFSPDFVLANAKLADARKSMEDLDRKIPDVMIMQDLPKPRDTYVLIRGQYNKHGEKVEPGLPSILPPLPKGQPMNRLGMARWIVDPSNPLTARVQVNRLWEKFFGTGIVKTSENFGTQASPPSNQPLLDWLAVEFVADHWDLKAIQKTIVTSAAYCQSSNVTPALLEMDPDNQLVARGPRFRLPAETIRDQALAVSGLLVEKIGGPSVRPYEPANLWEGNLFGNLSKYIQDKGDSLYRRSIYTFIKRTATPPNLSIFDQPTREYCVIKRSRTDTPLQALDLMDDPTYVEASRKLAEQMMIEGGSTPVDRINYGFRRVTCRMPTKEESEILLSGLSRQLARYRSDPGAALAFLHIGDSPQDKALNPSDMAAYTMTASVLLNLDETINSQ